MKIYNKTLGLLAVAASLVFAGCSDDDDFKPGEWDGPKDSQNVAFVGTSQSVELDPAEPTTVIINLTRTNTKGECNVPVEVLSNTDDVFEVKDAYFADGDSLGTLQVDFPKATIGKSYKVELAITDKKYSSSYNTGKFYTYTVNRVKWVSLGMGTLQENFWFEDEFEVEILQKDGDPTQFRIMHPFDAYASILDGNQSEYISLRILPTDTDLADVTSVLKGVSLTTKDLVYFPIINTGYFHSSYGQDVLIVHPAHFSSLCSEDNFKKSKVVSYKADGAPAQIQLAPYYYMNGVGGWNNITEDGVVLINFPGFTPKYEASIEDDFEWQAVYEGEYKSALLGTSTGATLEEGVCVNETDSCGARFEEEQGKLYRIASPYAQGYDLLFCVKDGWIVVPEDYTMQPTGTKALGSDVYATINGLKSSFEDGKVTLNITFTNKDKSLEYGTTDEVLENISWTPTYLGTYTYNFFFANEDGSPYYDEGLVLSQCDQNENKWKISSVFMGVDFVFNFDPKTNEVTFEEQSTGYEYPGYGMVYVAPLVKGNPYVDAEAPSYFEDGVFNFGLVYAIPAAGVYFTNCVGYETFTVTDAYDASAPVMLRNVKKNLSVKKNFQLSNKK